jgi:molybdopterin-guanine dinucleotide biosynthesis protein A
VPDMDALVLAGGESKRMGSPKALLPLGQTTLIAFVIGRLRPLFRQVLVVARSDEGLDHLGVPLITDDRPEQGPLVGLARGLDASSAPWCFAVGCDMPFIRPAVIRYMATRLDDCDILTPLIEGHPQLLHSFFAQGCLPAARDLLDRGVTSLRALLPLCRVHTIDAADFLELDPELLSFRDFDTPEDYHEAQRLLQALCPDTG